jgi:hypothetical protein
MQQLVNTAQDNTKWHQYRASTVRRHNPKHHNRHCSCAADKQQHSDICPCLANAHASPHTGFNPRAANKAPPMHSCIAEHLNTWCYEKRLHQHGRLHMCCARQQRDNTADVRCSCCWTPIYDSSCMQCCCIRIVCNPSGHLKCQDNLDPSALPSQLFNSGALVGLPVPARTPQNSKPFSARPSAIKITATPRWSQSKECKSTHCLNYLPQAKS